MSGLSRASQSLTGQPMFRQLAKVQEMERDGVDVIHFEIGDPDFATPKNICDAASKALYDGNTHYADSLGLYEFRETVCNVTERSRGFRPSVNQVLVTPGANIGIYYALRCLVDAGDDVVIPDPCFPTYKSTISFCGMNPVHVPLCEENGFRMKPDDLLKQLTPRTKLIIICSPHNPCGSVMTRQELNEVYDIAEQHDVYLLCDEIYSRMIYDDAGSFYSPSVRDAAKSRTIVLNGFSKAFAMTGWRLGCVVGPEEVIEKMGLLLQTTSSCVSPFIQKAGIEAMEGPQDEVWGMMKEYEERRDILVDGLNSLPGVTCLRPGGAFYVFPNITGTGMDESTFAERMLEEAGVSLLPGSNFGEAGKGYVRLCYAVKREEIEEGIERMRSFLERAGL